MELIFNKTSRSRKESLSDFKKEKLTKLLCWLAFFWCFNNFLLFGVNISLFFFLAFVFLTFHSYRVFSVKEIPQFAALFFAIGAIVSVIDTNSNSSNNIEKALKVLPNFLYWSFLIIIFINVLLPAGLISKKSISKVSKFISIGVVLNVIFYEFNDILNFPFLKQNTPNSYAFVLVCFSPIGATYIRDNHGKARMLAYTTVILSSLLLLERRAGFVLVLLSIFMALFFKKFNNKTLISLILTIILSYFVLQLSFIEKVILDASPRIHETIYEAENIATEDQSYLTRIAMIEKGMIIFKENPLTGIGLSNFQTHYVHIPGNFLGSELVIGKDLSNKSSHNSYVALLAEGGLFLLLPFLLLFTFNIYHFLRNFKKRTNLENAFYWSFLAMAVHIYFISEIFNVFAWFLIAVVSAISVKYLRLTNQPMDK